MEFVLITTQLAVNLITAAIITSIYQRPFVKATNIYRNS